MTVWVDLICIGHVPRAAGAAIIVCYCLLRGGILGLVGIESIAVLVLCAPNLTRSTGSIDLEDGVVGSVDIGINTHAEEMLVIVGIDAWINFRAPA